MINVYLSCAKVKPLDIENNFENAEKEVKKAISLGAKLVVFPQGFLTGTDIGILDNAPYFEKIYNETARKLSRQNPGVAILADRYEGMFTNCLYVDGAIKNGNEFEIDGYKFAAESYMSVAQEVLEHELIECDCFIFNSSEPIVAGERALVHDFLKSAHKITGAKILANFGGYGFTSHPYVYLPAVAEIDGEKDLFTQTVPEFISAEKLFTVEKRTTPLDTEAELTPLSFEFDFNTNPLVPRQIGEKEYCLDLFHLQTVALASRIDNIGIKNCVVAVSGGLDSALALLVTVNAFDMLGLDRAGIRAISMPGFGTSTTTKGLAQQLVESLGLEFKLIDITKTAHQALLDIGHDGVTPDVTFENVQARIRTLHGLNLANAIGGIMIGTGDLSEEALGFSTYGGDHLASYNVNSSVSKTVIRTMLPYVMELDNLKRAKDPIFGILTIPVSPELVPHGGEILQKTEEILAPYKLIDFYIYCFVVAKLSPKEMAEMAKQVFGDEFTEEYLIDKAEMFCRRFISGQFKRSCAPEGAILTHAALAGAERSVPSDAKMGLFKCAIGDKTE